MTKPIIGFIGLGDMGEPMAARLLQHGFQVLSSINRRRDAIERLKPIGIVERANPREVAGACDILISIVVDEEQTERILRGPDGALATLRPGSTIVLMSTLAPAYCQALATELHPKGIDLIDCPVSGGPMGAEKGTLALIAGGDPSTIERCRSALEKMGTIYPCGAVGLGMVAKLANNAVGLLTIPLVREARAMAAAYGMDMDTLMAVMRAGTANSFIVQAWNWVEAYGEKGAPVALRSSFVSGDKGPSHDNSQSRIRYLCRGPRCGHRRRSERRTNQRRQPRRQQVRQRKIRRRP
jgi:3-hydroxyisobutyrate dehydrogenase-like beta-hydroxyacid dehydrogenase